MAEEGCPECQYQKKLNENPNERLYNRHWKWMQGIRGEEHRKMVAELEQDVQISEVSSRIVKKIDFTKGQGTKNPLLEKSALLPDKPLYVKGSKKYNEEIVAEHEASLDIQQPEPMPKIEPFTMEEEGYGRRSKDGNEGKSSSG